MTFPQASQRAFKSSPCMCSTFRLPARSCRLSMFCVTTSTSPGHSFSSPASARCAALGLTASDSSLARRAL
jgi:hypothetical protein